MVDLINASAFEGIPSSGDRKLKGPLYTLDALDALLSAKAIVVWTRNTARDVQKLDLDDDQLIQLVSDGIHYGKYRDSEWCNQRPGGVWAACDSYELSRKEWNPAAHKDLICEYYIKLAIGKFNPNLLLVSCHVPRSK